MKKKFIYKLIFKSYSEISFQTMNFFNNNKLNSNNFELVMDYNEIEFFILIFYIKMIYFIYFYFNIL